MSPLGSLGIGVVVKQNEKYVWIKFSSRTVKFEYPAAFEKFLVAKEQDIQDTISEELVAVKAAEIVAKEAQVAEQKAEEEARLEALRNQSVVSGRKVSATKSYKPVKRVDGQALTYLVFQGSNYNEEREGQFIWASKFTKDGKIMHHWERLTDLREGDVIFHSSDGYIRAVSRVKGACEDSVRPNSNTSDWTNRGKDGRRVDCEYHELETPLKHGSYKEKILEYCNMKYAPFDKDGNGNTGYLYDLNQKLAAFFIQEIAKENPEVIDLDYLKFILVK